jgi:hypothetical protein
MRVSIVINNYNYGAYVGEAIDSALGQDYRDVEVVVVDDGSTDHSREVIRRYGDRIVPVFQANGGQGAALNAGFAACRGEAVLFLDADDRLKPSAISAIVGHFRPGVSKVQFGLELIDGEGRALGRPVLAGHPDPKTFLPLLREFLFYPSPPGSGNAYPRSFLERRMPLPPDPWKIAADSYLIFAAPLAGEIVYLDACLGEYRRHGAGASERSPGDAMAHAEKEYAKMTVAREYVAGLLRTGEGGAISEDYGLPPVGLKLALAHELFSCAGSLPAAEKRRFYQESMRTARGWTPWPWLKRWSLPAWTMLVCGLPARWRERFFAASLAHSSY